jgi:hypothetical protein
VRAKVGDWLVVPGAGREPRRGEILSVRCGGDPPYRVRWLDDDREAVIYPSSAAEVITAERQAELDLERSRRIDALQASIGNRIAHS